jgi:hypothetical protein
MYVHLIYSFKDRVFVEKIRNVLTRNDLQVFEIENLKIGASIIESIAQSIKNSQIFLFFISKNSEKSEFFSSEIALVLSEYERDQTKKIIPIILDNDVTIPPFLNQFMWLDLSTPEGAEEKLELLIRSIKADSIRQLSKDEISTYQKTYIKIGSAQLDQEKNQYQIISEEKSKDFRKFLLYLFIGVYSLIAIFGFYFLMKFLNIEFFSPDFFMFIIGILCGILASVLSHKMYKKIKNGGSKNE